MHVPYDTEKFYYGFPVYILAYPDEEVGVGITTGSSSYSLGQMVMIGCDSTTHAARSIKRSGVCSLNLFGAEAMGLFEYAGTISGGDKLSDAHVASSNYDGIPVLDDSQMSLVCRVLEATDDGTYTRSFVPSNTWAMHAAASTVTSQTRWSVSVHSCAPSRSRCSPEMTQTTRPEIPTRGPRPRSLAGCAEPAYSSSVPAYFGCARFSGERMRSTSSSDRSSISWMTSRTVLPSAAARLPTTSPRWWPMTSLK